MNTPVSPQPVVIPTPQAARSPPPPPVPYKTGLKLAGHGLLTCLFFFGVVVGGVALSVIITYSEFLVPPTGRSTLEQFVGCFASAAHSRLVLHVLLVRGVSLASDLK